MANFGCPEICPNSLSKIETAAQKKSVYASERDQQTERAEYREESSAIDVGRFKFIDEAGSNLAMTRRA